MGMGMPHICNAGVGDVDGIIDEKSGILIHALSQVDYEKAIQKLFSTSFDKAYIRSRSQQIYSLSAGVEKYKQVYEAITN
jgi:hypothetical protein